jgi:hypothetical protein
MPSPSTLLLCWQEALDAFKLEIDEEARKTLLYSYYKAVISSGDFVSRSKLINEFQPNVFLSFYTVYRAERSVDCEIYDLYIPGAFMAMEMGNLEERYHLVRLLTSDVLQQSCLLAKHLHADSMAEPTVADKVRVRRAELAAQGKDCIRSYVVAMRRKGKRSNEAEAMLNRIHCGLKDEPIYMRNLGMLRKVESQASCYVRLSDADYDDRFIYALVAAYTHGLVHYWREHQKDESTSMPASLSAWPDQAVDADRHEGSAENL